METAILRLMISIYADTDATHSCLTSF